MFVKKILASVLFWLGFGRDQDEEIQRLKAENEALRKKVQQQVKQQQVKQHVEPTRLGSSCEGWNYKPKSSPEEIHREGFAQVVPRVKKTALVAGDASGSPKENVQKKFYKSELLEDIGKNIFRLGTLADAPLELYHITHGKGTVRRVEPEKISEQPLYVAYYEKPNKKILHTLNQFHVFGDVKKICIPDCCFENYWKLLPEGCRTSRSDYFYSEKTYSDLKAQARRQNDERIRAKEEKEKEERIRLKQEREQQQRRDDLLRQEKEQYEKQCRERDRERRQLSAELWKQRENAPHLSHDAQRQRTIENHKTAVAQSGRLYSGYTVTCDSKPRVTHCYSCHKPLDSRMDIQCNSCGWLVCHCGACGCGYYAKTG